MVSVLLIWIYISLTAGVTGALVLRFFRYRPRFVVSYPLAGLAVLMVYAGVWSLFGGVGAAANIVLIAILMAGLAAPALLRVVHAGGRKSGHQPGGSDRRIKRAGRELAGRLGLVPFHGAQFLRALIVAAAVLFIAYGTSCGIWHKDTPLYHAQAIHWIESYGVVRGLGNLQSHFAYNNSCFWLYALYSLSWLTGQSFHAVQGYLAALLAVLCLMPEEVSGGRVSSQSGRGNEAFRHTSSGRRGRGKSIGFFEAFFPAGEATLTGEVISRFTDSLSIIFFLRAAGLVQILLLFDELVSPSSDAFVLLLTHLIVQLWARLADRRHREASPVPYALLSMLAVWAVTVKLAAAPLLLLAVKPVTKLLFGKKRDVRTFFLFLGTACVITLPYFARNILLSGWILYPALPQHLVSLPWQIPDGVGVFESFEIRENGRMILDIAEADTSLFGWVPGWYIRIPRVARLLALGAAAAVGWSVLHAILCAGIRLILRGVAGRDEAAKHARNSTRSQTNAGKKAVETAGTKRSSGAGSAGADLSGGAQVNLSALRRSLEKWTYLRNAESVFLELVLTGCVVFWFFTTPQVRFGEAYLLLLCAAVYGSIVSGLIGHLRGFSAGRGIAGGLIVILTMLAICAIARMEITPLPERRGHLFLQQDYERYPVDTYRIDGISFYYPTEFVYAGYYDFPATRWQDTDVRALGTSIRDGFAAK